MIDTNDTIFRKLTKDDYQSFLLLIKDFRDTYFTEEQFMESFSKITLNSDIYVLEYKGNLIATGTLIYETKFIFNICILAHIEDVCVKMEYRKYGLGKYLISKMIHVAKENKCYKITLDCADSNVEFYSKCNFEKRGNQMTVYFG